MGTSRHFANEPMTVLPHNLEPSAWHPALVQPSRFSRDVDIYERVGYTSASPESESDLKCYGKKRPWVVIMHMRYAANLPAIYEAMLLEIFTNGKRRSLDNASIDPKCVSRFVPMIQIRHLGHPFPSREFLLI